MTKLNLPVNKSIQINASIFKRLAAFIVDLVIVNLVIITPFRDALSSLIGGQKSFYESYNFLSSNPVLVDKIYTILFAITVFVLFYFSFLEYKFGQTIGKMLLRLYVISDEKKKKYFFVKCIVRNLFIIPFFPFLLLWIIDPIHMLFSKSNQRFTEKITCTKVVEKVEV